MSASAAIILVSPRRYDTHAQRARARFIGRRDSLAQTTPQHAGSRHPPEPLRRTACLWWAGGSCALPDPAPPRPCVQRSSGQDAGGGGGRASDGLALAPAAVHWRPGPARAHKGRETGPWEGAAASRRHLQISSSSLSLPTRSAILARDGHGPPSSPPAHLCPALAAQ